MKYLKCRTCKFATKYESGYGDEGYETWYDAILCDNKKSPFYGKDIIPIYHEKKEDFEIWCMNEKFETCPNFKKGKNNI